MSWATTRTRESPERVESTKDKQASQRRAAGNKKVAFTPVNSWMSRNCWVRINLAPLHSHPNRFRTNEERWRWMGQSQMWCSTGSCKKLFLLLVDRDRKQELGWKGYKALLQHSLSSAIVPTQKQKETFGKLTSYIKYFLPRHAATCCSGKHAAETGW